jgi:nicotinamide-nucleotide amidase
LIAELGLDPVRVARLLDRLHQRELTLACAESLTGGLLLAVLTAVPGASMVVRGGLVVYATDTKTALAGVPAELLAEHGPVHPNVAVALARGAALRCRAGWGVGLTGVAGPDPQHGVPPGTVHVGLCAPAGVSVRTLRAAGDRHAVRLAAVRAALDGLDAALDGLDGLAGGTTGPS